SSNAERKGKNHHQCECRIGNQLSEGIPRIIESEFDETGSARFATILFHLLMPSKRQPRPPLRFFLRHAGPPVLLNLLIEMKPEFFVELILDLLVVKQRVAP